MDDLEDEVELAETRFLGQYSLKLLFIQTFYFACWFGYIKSYLYPNYIESLYKYDTDLYYSAWVLIFCQMMAVYFGLLYGRNNIFENPKKWWDTERFSITLLGCTIAILAATCSLLVQLVLLDL